MFSLIGEYLMNILRWLDIGVNVIFLLGSYNETISERSARARNKGEVWGCVLCKILDSIVKNHCDNSLTTRIGADAILED